MPYAKFWNNRSEKLIVTEFEGLNAVITGASGGLGTALTGRLVSLGANVVSIDRHPASEPHSTEGQYCYDLTKSSGVESAAGAVSKAFSHVDLLVNCAGVFLPDDPLENAKDTLEYLWQNNTASTVLFTLALEPVLKNATSPSVINIGSTDGIVASGGQGCEVGVSHDVFYALTKGAVIAFTRALAMKWSAMGIRVNTICPTVFDSPMTESLLTEAKRTELSSHIPLGRLATKDDIVDAIIHAHQMKFTTGHVFPVDGGYLCQ